MDSPRIRRALISVSDKMGLGVFARQLADAGVELLSTGGTARHLREEGLEVVEVADYTGFPEMMHGRLKTLHPKIFGGILARRDEADDQQAMETHDIGAIDLVVVNLYPFEATIAREGVTLEEAIEQIDIGGPSLVRAAAKNHKHVTIATHQEQYATIIEEIKQHGMTSIDTRRQLAAEAFAHTAAYDRAIAEYFTGLEDDAFAPSLHLMLCRKAVLRYGENPHQQAALYQDPGHQAASIVTARQLHGKELSYNNLMDLDAALGIARTLPDAGVAVLKHTNPCGAASHGSLATAAKRALAGDPASAFGSVVGVNQTVDAATAQTFAEDAVFIEAIVAPDYDAQAIEILTTQPKWKTNVRIMATGPFDASPSERHVRQIDGGLLVQNADVTPDDPEQWKVVTNIAPSDAQLAELAFAWTIVRFVKSNAIVLCQDRMLCGVGAGQMSRVDSVEIAIHKAGDRAAGSVLASDAFFPFADSIQRAAGAGVTAIIQPGGSRRDQEVIDACNALNLPMIFTGRRHFRH